AFNQATYVVRTGNHVYISNCYFHGWTHTACTNGPYCDGAYLIGGGLINNGGHYVIGSDNQVFGNSFDGSDTDGRSTYAIYYDVYDFHNNIVRYVSNGIVSNNLHTIHDNLFEHISESYDPTTHSNVVEANGEAPGVNFVYNNVFRYNGPIGVYIWTVVDST